MNIVVRCHAKNQERLALLRRYFDSCVVKKMAKLGKIKLLDDASPLAEEVQRVCLSYGVEYRRIEGQEDTKRGLAESLRLEYGNNEPVLCTVDDMVWGKGSLEMFTAVEKDYIPWLANFGVNWGLIGSFACYNRQPNMALTSEVRLWELPLNIVYALVCHVYSSKLKKIIVDDWDKVQRNEIPYPGMCDDLWCVQVMMRENLKCLNTMEDYAQHTGINQRAFSNDNKGSEYISPVFVGE